MKVEGGGDELNRTEQNRTEHTLQCRRESRCRQLRRCDAIHVSKPKTPSHHILRMYVFMYLCMYLYIYKPPYIHTHIHKKQSTYIPAIRSPKIHTDHQAIGPAKLRRGHRRRRRKRGVRRRRGHSARRVRADVEVAKRLRQWSCHVDSMGE